MVGFEEAVLMPFVSVVAPNNASGLGEGAQTATNWARTIREWMQAAGWTLHKIRDGLLSTTTRDFVMRSNGEPRGVTATITNVGGITAIAVSMTVSADVFPLNEFVAINGEQVKITNKVGLTYTIARAQNGTVATAHAQASVIYLPKDLFIRVRVSSTGNTYLSALIDCEVGSGNLVGECEVGFDGQPVCRLPSIVGAAAQFIFNIITDKDHVAIAIEPYLGASGVTQGSAIGPYSNQQGTYRTLFAYAGIPEPYLEGTISCVTADAAGPAFSVNINVASSANFVIGKRYIIHTLNGISGAYLLPIIVSAKPSGTQITVDRLDQSVTAGSKIGIDTCPMLVTESDFGFGGLLPVTNYSTSESRDYKAPVVFLTALTGRAPGGAGEETLSRIGFASAWPKIQGINSSMGEEAKRINSGIAKRWKVSIPDRTTTPSTPQGYAGNEMGYRGTLKNVLFSERLIFRYLIPIAPNQYDFQNLTIPQYPAGTSALLSPMIFLRVSTPAGEYIIRQNTSSTLFVKASDLSALPNPPFDTSGVNLNAVVNASQRKISLRFINQPQYRPYYIEVFYMDSRMPTTGSSGTVSVDGVNHYPRRVFAFDMYSRIDDYIMMRVG
jgi:hypothetical protein